jgi:hypothetical protein
LKKIKTLAVLLVLAVFFSMIVGNCDDSKPENNPEKTPGDNHGNEPGTPGLSLKYNSGTPVSGDELEVAIIAGSLTFTAVNEKNETIDFTLRSSSTAVARVSGKTITLVKVGETDITATARGDSTRSQSFKLKVLPDTQYNITVEGGTADKQLASAGEIITLIPDVISGKEFSDWTIEQDGVQMLSGKTFRMPAFDVKATANFTDWSPAGKKPYFITNNYGQNASTELLVQWHNDIQFETQTFQIVEASGDFAGAETTTVTGNKFLATNTAPLYIGDFEARNVFKIEKTGLTPNTRYKYRMGDGDDERWSDTFYHTTASASYADFSFTVVADPQSDDSTDMDVTLQAANAYDSDNRFFLMLGDIVNQIGKNPSEIHNYTNVANNFNKERPIIATQGNHDTYRAVDVTGQGSNDRYMYGEATVFNKFVTFPNNGWDDNPDKENRSQSYYFYYNNVLIIVLNTMATQDNTTSSTPGMAGQVKQAAWLKNILENDKNNNLSKYRFVVTHVSPFGGRTSERHLQREVRASYGKIFTDFNVDIVFAGHDHVYGRSNPIKITGTTTTDTTLQELQPQFETGTSGGVVYSIAGATGPKFYQLEGDPLRDQYFPVRTDTQSPGVFVNVKVSAGKLTVTAVRGSGAVIDEYNVQAKN